MQDCIFDKEKNLLRVRRSSQAAIAQAWFEQRGITTQFHKTRWWYTTQLPELPEKLAEALERRSQRVSEPRRWGPL